MYTGLTLLLFLLFSRVPLVGISTAKGNDPFYWLRAIMASNRGTLMELGISPIVTSGMIIQLLAGTKLISVDQSVKSERALFNSVQKLAGILFTFVQAFAYVLFGTYGPISELGFRTIIIIAQLCVAGVIITILDEFLQKGYGIGSGTSLFIATNICEGIVWQCFSPNTSNFGRGTEFEGCLIALIHLLITRADKGKALVEAFTRSHLPNVSSLISTALIFLLVIYFQGIRVELSLGHHKARNYQGNYPIKLFYNSNTPIILQSSLTSLVFFFSQMLWRSFPNSFIISLIGDWRSDAPDGVSGRLTPVGGIAYYLSAPNSFSQVIHDPLHSIIYLAFMLTTTAWFSRMWINLSGNSAKDVAQQLKEQDLFFPGYRDNMIIPILNRYIPVAASFGGMCVGLLTVLADFLGCMGSGTGILLAVTTIYQYFETIVKEGADSGFNFFQ